MNISVDPSPPVLNHAKPIRLPRRQLTGADRQSWPAWMFTIAACLCGPPRPSPFVTLKDSDVDDIMDNE